MSASRLQLALSSRISVKDWNMKSDAEMMCKLSTEPEQVMTVLRLHGVPWDELLCSYAAVTANLSLLQWLRSSSCPWVEYGVLCNAGRGGSVAVLEWLLAVTTA
jgi:hypothetical protein